MMFLGKQYSPVATRRGSDFAGKTQHIDMCYDPLRLVATRCDSLWTHKNEERPQLFTIFTCLRPPHRLDTYNIIKGEVSGGTGLDAHWRVGWTNIALGAVCLTGL